MERTLKIFISCALGAGIGTLVALELNHYFWWVGLLIGGFVGYLSYEFKEVVSTTRQSWHAIIGWRPNWDKLRLRWKYFWLFQFCVFLFILNLIPIFGIAYFFALIGFIPVATVNLLVFFSYVVLPVLCFILVPITPDFWIEKFSQEELRELKKEMSQIYPTKVYLKWLPCLIKKFSGGMVMVFKFIKNIFILIHSDIRLLCGVDAAIGAGIGYYAGSVIIGMLAGGALGIVNYEFVSRRLLKLHLQN